MVDFKQKLKEQKMANSKKNTAQKEVKNQLDLNTGFLHHSTNKTHQDSPDFFGSMNVDGELFQVAGWRKEKKGSEDNYIQLAFRPDSIEIDEWEDNKKDFVKKYKKEKKEFPDMYITMNYTGSLHKKVEKGQDFFGTVRIDGEIVRLSGLVMTGKELPIIRLKVSEGLSEEKREELSNSFC